MSEWKTHTGKIKGKIAAIQNIPRDVNQAAQEIAHLKGINADLVEALKDIMEQYGSGMHKTKRKKFLDLIDEAEDQTRAKQP